jgi:hypothetical protein
MNLTRQGRFLSLGLAALVLCGCVSRAVYHDAAESGWKRWEQDRRPTVTDDAYNAMSEEERALYLPAAKVAAREFERDNALGLLKD